MWVIQFPLWLSSLLVVSGNYTLHLADDFMYTDPVSYNSVDFGFSGFDHQNSLQSGSVMWPGIQRAREVLCALQRNWYIVPELLQVDGSVATKQGIRFIFTDGSRIIFRLSVSTILVGIQLQHLDTL